VAFCYGFSSLRCCWLYGYVGSNAVWLSVQVMYMVVVAWFSGCVACGSWNRCDSEWHFGVLEEFPSLCICEGSMGISLLSLVCSV